MVDEAQHRSDVAYGELSLRAGWLAGAADRHLGGDHFITATRAHRWHLTETKLQDWKREAIALGVPADLLDPPSNAVAPLVQEGMKQQRIVDAQSELD